MYSAFRLSNGEDSKEGFATEEEAWEYVKQFLCQSCLDALNRGYIEIEWDGETDQWTMDHVSCTSCGAEWIVEETEKFDDCESMRDVLRRFKDICESKQESPDASA